MNEQLERLQRILGQQEASDIRVHDWGVRDMAYPIENHRRGRYVLVEYDGTAAAVRELERNLKLSDQVLRYMSVRQTNGGQQIVPEMGSGAEGESGEVERPAARARAADAAEGDS